MTSFKSFAVQWNKLSRNMSKMFTDKLLAPQKVGNQPNSGVTFFKESVPCVNENDSDRGYFLSTRMR